METRIKLWLSPEVEKVYAFDEVSYMLEHLLQGIGKVKGNQALIMEKEGKPQLIGSMQGSEIEVQTMTEYAEALGK
jgi:hypothetical protein